VPHSWPITSYTQKGTKEKKTLNSDTKIKSSPFKLDFMYTLSSALHGSTTINLERLFEHIAKEETSSSTSSL